MSLKVERVNPLTMGDQLKTLFMDNERPDYSSWFDRAYPIAVQEGAASWVLVDSSSSDKVVAHVGGFHARLSVGGRDLRGGLLVNLMVDKEYRTFFPVVSVIKRALKDMREDGAEFIYTNPINPGAIVAMRAAGLKEIGATNHFVLPLGHANALIDRGLASIVWARRKWLRRVRAGRVDLAGIVRWTAEERCNVTAVSSRRMPTIYHMRCEAFGSGQDMGFQLTDQAGSVVGGAIVRVPDGSTAGWLTTLRCISLEWVAEGLAAVAAELRAIGVRRLGGRFLMNTPFATELVRGGFLQRKEPWVVVASGYTDLGREAAAGLAVSDIEAIDLD